MFIQNWGSYLCICVYTDKLKGIKLINNYVIFGEALACFLRFFPLANKKCHYHIVCIMGVYMCAMAHIWSSKDNVVLMVSALPPLWSLRLNSSPEFWVCLLTELICPPRPPLETWYLTPVTY